ncbi:MULTISPECIES: hypothetical protein [Chryseobacterium]|uniref:hypothetical protein n=1 Tax=Chryseobacterium TaxID=59732 RepID=UPI001625BBA5|nr:MULTISPECIES: hypothetical protein [Chryseobacterium]MDM1555197.1 hypothetical protein [Chryseobacterium indologenes]
MDHIETEQIDLTRDKKFVDEYFTLVIKKELDLDVNLSNEYRVAQNIVSKKLILVKTFSDRVLEDPSLYLLLASLIQDINTHSLTKRDLVSALGKK